MIEKIEILQHRESCDFCCHPCEETLWLLCVVAYHHQMVIQLREYRFNSLSVSPIDPTCWSPVLLVQSVWYFKYGVCQGKQALPHGSTQIPFVSKYHTVIISPLNILQIMQIMHVSYCHIIGMYDTRCAVTRAWSL